MNRKRKLTEKEIEDILDFVKPNINIPERTAQSIVEKTKQDFRIQLQNIVIYPSLIPTLKNQIENTYVSSLIPAGKCVGIITAQSIGERQTQANLNSVDWKEKLIYKSNDEIIIQPIGKMIDDLLTDNKEKIEFLEEQKTEYLNTEKMNLQIPSCDELGFCNWYKIEGITRHLPQGELIYIKTQSGRDVIITRSKSLIVWNDIEKKFLPKNGSEVKIGDILPITKNLHKPNKEINILSLRTVFPPEQYVYTSEIVKARFAIYDWKKRNNKEFILPYKRRDTCFGKRKKYYMDCKEGFVEYLHSRGESKFPENLPLDGDFGFLTGIYLAEGLVTKTYISIANNAKEILDRVKIFCEKYGLGYHIVVNTKHKHIKGVSTDIRIHSVLLAKLLKTLCNTGSSNKKVPTIAFNAPDIFITNLIDGYFSGDGTVNKRNGYIIASSASKELINGISILLNYFGIFSYMSGTQPKYNNIGSKNLKYSHTLTVRNKFAQIFAEKIHLTEVKKQKRLVEITLTKQYMYIYGKYQKNMPHDRDVYFDPIVSIDLGKGTCDYVYDLTVEKTRNFQLLNGLVVRDTFHRAGSSDKQPVVSKFAELLNATSKPKAPSYFIYFNEGNTNVPELRETIGNSLVQLCLKQITKHSKICFDKEHEKWYSAFFKMNGEMDSSFTDCISLTIDINKLYEYKLTLKKVCEVLAKEYADLYCIYSPDCIGKIDVFVKTDSIEVPEKKMAFINENNIKEVFMEEVFQPTLENIMICGISGIKNMYFLQDGKQWYIETENSKGSESIGFKSIKEKPVDSAKRFRQVLAHSKVDMTKTLSNNVWDIYFTFGIEAVRQYMIDEFSKIMDGINICHVMLLVDKMTFKGSISSVSRYSMRSADSGVFSKASFEETLSNFLDAGVYGQEEPIKGPSAAIICGKRAPVGTGLCNLEVDVEKLLTIKEEEEEE